MITKTKTLKLTKNDQSATFDDDGYLIIGSFIASTKHKSYNDVLTALSDLEEVIEAAKLELAERETIAMQQGRATWQVEPLSYDDQDDQRIEA